MQVLLINPMTKSVTTDIMPPLGLAWLAAVLEQSCINVGIIDALVERKDAEAVAVEVGQACPDIVGIYCGTDMRRDAFQTAYSMKKACPGATIVMGGPHVTFAAEDTLQNIPSVDIICRGEGEETFLELLSKAESCKEVFDMLGEEYRLGYHKAAKMAQIGLSNEIWAVTDIDNIIIKKALMVPYDSIQLALDEAVEKIKGKGKKPRIIIMPFGSLTVPKKKKDEN